MKTIAIFESDESTVQFFVAEGDLSRFNSIYINGMGEDMEEEFAEFLYKGSGGFNVEMLTTFPLQVAKEDDVIVITCGSFS